MKGRWGQLCDLGKWRNESSKSAFLATMDRNDENGRQLREVLKEERRWCLLYGEPRKQHFLLTEHLLLAKPSPCLVSLILSVTLQGCSLFLSEEGNQVTAKPGVALKGLCDGTLSPLSGRCRVMTWAKRGPEALWQKRVQAASPEVGLFQEWVNAWCQLQCVPMARLTRAQCSTRA